ncbi:MAG TPA: 50S ribosomal protein L6 [Clostridia bacterium]|nr:50S ribosomal protein L6 [Clostridia bacterium]
MSRVGKMPVLVPQGVEVKIESNIVTVKGPKGQLQRELHRDVEIGQEEGQIVVKSPSESKTHKSLQGLTRTLVNNMVIGVTKGFEKQLELTGVGYRAAKQGNKLVLSVGYSHPVEIDIEQGLDIEVVNPTRIVVRGADSEKVGALAANIRAVREPEPYKGKGIRYSEEYVRRKAGKAGVK